MHRIRLIHRNAAEAEVRASLLWAAGYEVDAEPFEADGLRALRADPPDAIIIDLSRAPSHGRDVGLSLRKYKDTRRVPLVFVEGAAEKVAGLRDLLPDAVYTTWRQMPDALAQAIAQPPTDPVVPSSVFAPYASTPLPKKLGITAGAVVALVGAPDGFEATLGDLPEGVVLHREAHGEANVTLWFNTSRVELERDMQAMGARYGAGRLWIIWPKKASRVASDLSQTVVRETGLASGLVDFKICSVDKTWSGLCFTQRQAEAG